MSSDGTIMVVDQNTGGMKGQKPQRLSDLDPAALWELAGVAGMGADKYERGNYLKGYDWSLCMDALYRHFLSFQMGEDNDPESGFSHMAHVAWHALALVSFQVRGIGTDDRLPTVPRDLPKLTVQDQGEDGLMVLLEQGKEVGVIDSWLGQAEEPEPEWEQEVDGIEAFRDESDRRPRLRKGDLILWDDKEAKWVVHYKSGAKSFPVAAGKLRSLIYPSDEVAWADPNDEGIHFPRFDRDGEEWQYDEAAEQWRFEGTGDRVSLKWLRENYGPLTFSPVTR